MNEVIENIKALHRKFWSFGLENALQAQFASAPGTGEPPPPSMDMTLSPDQILQKNLCGIEASRRVHDDRIPSCWVNYGPAFLPALAGAIFDYDRDTSWAHPNAPEDIRDLHIIQFSREIPLWKDYERKFIAVQKLNRDWMTGICDMVGPFDILAGLIGAERLCYEMIDSPVEIARLAGEAVKFWLDVYDTQFSLLEDKSGTTDCFGLFCPGRGARWSEDFMSLVSAELYRGFIFDCDCRIASNLDCSYLHVHSVAIDKIPSILKNERLSGIEISNDPNGPSLERIIEAGIHACSSRKALMLSNWSKKIPVGDFNNILAEIPNDGLIVTHEAFE